MVCVVGEQHMSAIVYLKVEATVYAMVCLHAILKFFCVASSELCHCHSCDTVVDVDWHGLTELHSLHVLYWRDEVEGDCSVIDDDILSMEVALMAAIVVHLHTFLHRLFHLQVAMYDECATWLNECCIVAEALKVCFFCAVDVEVVRVGCCDDTHPRAKPMERAVELVGFYHYIVAFVRDYVVGTVVLRYTSEECVAVDMTLVHDVCTHG